MTTPALLKAGDKVAVAAPARKVSPDEIRPAVDLLKSWQLDVELPSDLYGSCSQWSGTDKQRADQMQKLLDDKDVRAIFCARGGYGTVRIVDRLDFTRFVRHPKWIVGFSDITVLHSHVASISDVATLHATMPIDIPADATSVSYDSVSTMQQLLFGGSACYNFTNTMSTANRPGRACGTIVGGNLSVMYSLLGSVSDVDTDGKILFLEDLDEYLYHIDRMMTALKRANKLAGLKGLVVGQITKMHDNAVPFGSTAEEIVYNAVREYDFPVAFNAPFGHIGTSNSALMLNHETELEVGRNQATMKFRHTSCNSPEEPIQK